MIDEQLGAAVEQLGEGLGAVLGLEPVVLLDRDPRLLLVSSSPRRVSSFSSFSSSSRSACHSSCVPILCSVVNVSPPVCVRGPPYTVSTMANDTFSALAHPLRREIVERLSKGPATVGEVTRDFGVSKPTISRHLRTLEEAGVVSRVIVGRNHRLALRSETLAGAEEWIKTQRNRWELLFDVVGEYLDERKERR